MTPFTVKTNSWHYKLAKFGKYDAHYGDHDICAYMRRVLFGLFGVIVLTVIGICFAGSSCFYIGLTFYALYKLIFGIALDPVDWVLIGLPTAVGISNAIPVIIRRLQRKRSYFPTPEPGFVKTAYRSWKDKYCVKLKIVDDDGSVIMSSIERGAKNRLLTDISVAAREKWEQDPTDENKSAMEAAELEWEKWHDSQCR
jgi:hypothetical protein